MKFQDVFWLSYKDLSEKRVRTALTVVMVVIGVASIVALVSQTSGISASIQKSLQSLGPTTIIVSSTKAAGFTAADVAQLASLPNASIVIPIVEGQGTFASGNENVSASIVGISSQNLEQLLGGNPKLYEGTLYQDTVAPVSLVGYSIAFPSTAGGRQSVGVGQPATLTVGSGRSATTYTVPIVGVLQSYGSMIVSIDGSVFMSLQAAEGLLHKTSFNVILVKASNTTTVTPLASQISDIYGNNARVLTTQQIAQEVDSVIGSITVLLVIIAGISLLVAAIGIMNIMLMAVMERTHEIGILKSIGFKSRHVMMVFLFQALIIGFVGGMIGIALGGGASFGLAYIISHSSSSSPSSSQQAQAAGPSGSQRGGGVVVRGGGGGAAPSSSGGSSLSYQPVISIQTVIGAMIVAMVVSAIAGLYPAWRASRMQPIDALRQL